MPVLRLRSLVHGYSSLSVCAWAGGGGPPRGGPSFPCNLNLIRLREKTFDIRLRGKPFDVIRCPALIRLMRHQWTPQGWEDPLADHEDSGHDPWGAYGVLEDLDHDCAWAFDDACFRSD